MTDVVFWAWVVCGTPMVLALLQMAAGSLWGSIRGAVMAVESAVPAPHKVLGKPVSGRVAGALGSAVRLECCAGARG
jgi:hypothetical protein